MKPITDDLINRIIKQQKKNRDQWRSYLPDLEPVGIIGRTLKYFNRVFKYKKHRKIEEIPYKNLRVKYSKDLWECYEDPYGCLLQLGLNPDEYNINELYDLVGKKYSDTLNEPETQEDSFVVISIAINPTRDPIACLGQLGENYDDIGYNASNE